MANDAKSAQLQIRVSPAQKTAIQRAARDAGMDMSSYVLTIVLPDLAQDFQSRIDACRGFEGRFALAELNTFLSRLTASELRMAVASPPPAGMTDYLANYIAAMVEHACALRKTHPPDWVRDINPLTEPVFASALETLRLHLLSHSPAAFRRRNLFIDSSIGAQI
jgi:Protein of unknown function (DUF1778)